jgi:hypothetical protein
VLVQHLHADVARQVAEVEHGGGAGHRAELLEHGAAAALGRELPEETVVLPGVRGAHLRAGRENKGGGQSTHT